MTSALEDTLSLNKIDEFTKQAAIQMEGEVLANKALRAAAEGKIPISEVTRLCFSD